MFKSLDRLAVITITALSSLLIACGDQSDVPPESFPETVNQTPAQPNQITIAQAQKLTTELLEKQGAKKLNNNEILELIVDNSIVFEHLETGEYFEAIYKADGRRLLTNVDSGSLDDSTLQDAYIVKDGKLQTEFKGRPIASVIYSLDNRYLAAIDSDNGVVNYEIRDIVKAPLTVTLLKSQNAKVLSTEQIIQLFVGNKILIKDLFTGDEYIGIYDHSGIRTLQYTNPLATPENDSDLQASNPYQIRNNLLYSTIDGNEMATTILQQDLHYYGAMSIDDGAVHYEFVPQSTPESQSPNQ
ncbi:hypothetical protein [Kaarinaea lacus]